MLTGGAWLLRELSGSFSLCGGPLGAPLGGPLWGPLEALLDCGGYPQQPAAAAARPRHLTAAESDTVKPWGPFLQGTDGPAAAEGEPATLMARTGPLTPRAKPQHSKHQHQQQKQHQQQQKQQQQRQQQQQQQGGFVGFLRSVASSTSLVAATELGDRTFFLAALLALRYSRLLVFAATCAALFVAAAASAAAGYLLQSAAASAWLAGPLGGLLKGGPLLQLAAAAALLLFGLHHLYKAKKAWGPHRGPPRRVSTRSSQEALGAPLGASLGAPAVGGPLGAPLGSPLGAPLGAAPFGGPLGAPLAAEGAPVLLAGSSSSGAEGGACGGPQEGFAGAPKEGFGGGSPEGFGGAPKGGPPDDASVSTRLSPAEKGEEEICDGLEEAQEDLERFYVNPKP
ncbi:hypothetical protein, conserved [Eimeria tenella]|uniref:GDT1 family protein n=1 Tax=Eimeria tenella TaxID=5802 RepID=U6KUI9_EIMTE|nr:hypothetical protein, conserved [Eimeria tenella]CDJ39170.1 hypothetical protein, conserved [Eimeria tenella]|eukprot:XP_013229925.1 hypothetical protein, conserved [Eimeria tenella]